MNIQNILKKTAVFCCFFSQVLFAQDCDESVVPPGIVNGVSVTSTSTGSVDPFTAAFTSCGYETPANSIHLGETGAFVYTFNFSEPVNDIIFFITGAGTDADEDFVITSDDGVPTITDLGSCFATIVANTLSIGDGGPLTGAGGAFQVTSPGDGYTSFTITGPGGSDGSLFSLCSNSVMPVPPDFSSVNASCFGVCDGEATVLDGDDGPYTYLWDIEAGAGTDATTTGLCAGNYAVAVTSFSGEVNVIDVLIEEPDEIIGAITGQTNVSCNGATDGEVTVSVTGTFGAFTLDIGSGPVTTTTFTGLSEGVYNILVEDENGCTIDIPVTITEPTAITLTEVTSVMPLCFGDANGSIEIIGGGGTSPYTYSMDGGAFDATTNFTGLAAGDYDFTVRDASGCESDITITLAEPAVLTLAESAVISPSCFGESDASLLVIGNGGTSPLEYSINGGAFGSSAFFPGLPAADYTVAVRDANGCSTTILVPIIEQIPLLLSEVDAINPICFGDATGSVEVSGSGGTGLFEYSSDGVGYGPASTFTGLVAGDYTFYVRDLNDCVAELMVTITEPAEVILTEVSAIDPLCFGGMDGAIEVIGSGGDGTYSYGIDGGLLGATASFTGLNAGTYSINTADGNGCVGNIDITISEPAELELTEIATNSPDCFGEANGSLQVMGAGGTPTYSYAIDGGAFGVSSTFIGLAAGNYTITVQDANNCTTDLEVTIVDAVELVLAEVNITSPSCTGDGDGSIEVIGSGGVGSYEYAINGGAFGASPTFTGLAAGDYTVTVQDANDCTVDIIATITATPAVAVDVVTVLDVVCNGDASGAITIAGAGGTAPYEYALDGGIFGGTGVFNGLAAGNYTLSVQDANNCTQSLDVAVSEPTLLSITLVDQTDLLCGGGTGGIAVVEVLGGVGPYASLPDGTTFGTGTVTFTGLSAGASTLEVADASGCIVEIDVLLTEPPVLSITEVATIEPVCFEDPTGTIEVIGLGGVAPYEYAIDGGLFGAGNTFTDLAAGTYTLTVEDANNCTSDLAITIAAPPELLLTEVSVNNPSCGGELDGGLQVVGSGGTPTYEYSIDGGGFGISPTFIGLGAGSYTVTVRDANGCTTDLVVVITEDPLLVVDLVFALDPLCEGEATGSITVSGAGGVGPYEYSMDGGPFGGLGVFNDLAAGDYAVSVLDANGCTALLTVTLVEPPILTITLVDQTDPLCAGGMDGEIEVIASGGTAPYEFTGDGATFTTSTTITGLGAGTNTITVFDANGCTNDVTVVLTEPVPLVLTEVLTTNPICFDDLTGIIEVIGSGGTAPYEYTIDGGAFGVGTTFTGLGVGSYTITVEDANGCTTDLVIPITPPTELILTEVTIVPPTCFGDLDGTIEVIGSGGVAPYEYAMDGGVFGAGTTFTGLGAGDYTITVEDANGCTTDLVVTVTEPLELMVTEVTVVNPSCFGDLNGSIEVVGVGGTAPYTYALDGGAFGTLTTFVDLGAGDYAIAVEDANGCLADIVITLVEPTILVLAEVATINPTCFGGVNGSLEVIGSGGVAPYEYAIDGGAFDPAVTMDGLAAGDYTVTVQDANGCLTDITVTLTEPTELILTEIMTTNPICFVDATGTAEVLGSGGTGPYEYAIDGGAFGVGVNFTGLLAGDYTVTVRDGNDCTTDLVVTITSPAELILTEVAVISPTCFGDADATIEVVGSGGVAPYTYAINGGVFDVATIFTGLTIGDYIVTVQDANNCTVDLSVEVTEPTVLSLTEISAINPICFGDANGIVEVLGVGGTAPYEYAINGGVFSPLAVFPDLIDGDYNMVVMDANGCTADLLVTLTEPALLVLNEIVATDPICFGGTDGLIEVLGTGGIAPYEYALDGITFDPSPVINDLSVGDYTIVVMDANGCTANIAISLSEPIPVVLNEATIVSPNCFGESNGSIEVIATDGVLPYTYSFSGGVFDTDFTFTDLAAGTYPIVVNDANGCEESIDVVVTEPPLLTVTETVVSETCFGDCAGQITLAGAGGVGAYTYSIDNCLTPGASGTFTGLCAADYNICVQDANGCQYNSVLTIASGIIPADASITSFGPLCENEAPVILNAVVAGVYSGPGVVGTSFDPSIAGAGLHTIVNTIGGICGSTATVDVLVNPLPIVSFMADVMSGCDTVDVNFTNTAATSVSCLWEFGDGSTSTDCGAAFHVYDNIGLYDVQLTVTDANGCADTALYTDLIEVFDSPEANFTANPTIVNTANPLVDFNNLSNNSVAWEWNFAGLGNSSGENPSFLFPNVPGVYEVELLAISADGCEDLTKQAITVQIEQLIYVPNVFTPDGNSFNDVFLPYITGIDIYDYHLMIFNRWGEILFESFDSSAGWDGTYGGEIVQDGVYVWKITTAENGSDKKLNFNGHITVLK